MKPFFPLRDVVLRQVTETPRLHAPVYSTNYWQMNQQEFAMQVEGVADIYVSHGNRIEYVLKNGTQPELLELYLCGSVYGAVLHQRAVLPLHGSSVAIHNGAVVICGEAGSGKSSITAAACLNGAEFLTDDITPIDFPGGKPVVLPLSGRIKLWEDTMQQLGLEKSGLTAVFPGESKYYFPMEKGTRQPYPLSRVLILTVTRPGEPMAVELKGIESFTALRNELYRWEFLCAMPDTETACLEKLLTISRNIPVIRVFRPEGIPIEAMMKFLETVL
jgi:hypothetical protein